MLRALRLRATGRWAPLPPHARRGGPIPPELWFDPGRDLITDARTRREIRRHRVALQVPLSRGFEVDERGHLVESYPYRQLGDDEE